MITLPYSSVGYRIRPSLKKKTKKTPHTHTHTKIEVLQTPEVTSDLTTKSKKLSDVHSNFNACIMLCTFSYYNFLKV